MFFLTLNTESEMIILGPYLPEPRRLACQGWCLIVVLSFSRFHLLLYSPSEEEQQEEEEDEEGQSAAQTVAKQQYFGAQQRFCSRLVSGVILRELVMKAMESSHQDPHIQLKSNARLISKLTLSPAQVFSYGRKYGPN